MLKITQLLSEKVRRQRQGPGCLFMTSRRLSLLLAPCCPWLSTLWQFFLLELAPNSDRKGKSGCQRSLPQEGLAKRTVLEGVVPDTIQTAEETGPGDVKSLCSGPPKH